MNDGFNTAVAAAVGVALGLIANSILELIKSRFSAFHSRESLRRSLLAELKAANSTLRHNLKSVKSRASDGSLVRSPILEFSIYDQAIPRLGELSLVEISAVIDAYSWLKHHPKMTLNMGGEILRPDALAAFHSVHDSWLPQLILLYEETVREVEKSIAILELKERLPVWSRFITG